MSATVSPAPLPTNGPLQQAAVTFAKALTMLNPAGPGPTLSFKRSLELVIERAELRRRLLLDNVGAVLTLSDEGSDWLAQRLAHELAKTRRNQEEVIGMLDAITVTLRAVTTLAVASMNGEAANGAMEVAVQPVPPPAPIRAPLVIAPCSRPTC